VFEMRLIDSCGSKRSINDQPTTMPTSVFLRYPLTKNVTKAIVQLVHIDVNENTGKPTVDSSVCFKKRDMNTLLGE